MKITLNGDEIFLQTEVTLSKFLEEKKSLKRSGIAVAINEVVIPKNDWKKVILENNDTILIITAVQGG